MEERTAPAVFNVTTTADTSDVDHTNGFDAAGNISLPSALMAGNNLGGTHTIKSQNGAAAPFSFSLANSSVKAVWVYTDQITVASARDSLVNESVAGGVNTIYISVYQSTPNSDGLYMYDEADIAALITLAHANGIQVWADYGAPDWPSLGVDSSSFPMQRLAEVVTYNAANPTAAFDGVMLDVETSPGISDAQENTFLTELLPLYQAAQGLLNPAGIQLGAAISAYWNPNTLTNSADQAAVTITFSPHGAPVTEPAYQQIIDLGLEQVVVLGYRNFAGNTPPVEGEGIIGLDQDEVNYAVSTDSPTLIVAGLETQNLTPSDETFFSDGNAAMNGVAQKVAEFFGGNLAGFAIDAYGNVYLSGQPNWPDSNQATPKITWNNPANITFGTPLTATQLDATASVAGTFAYTLSDGVTSAEGAILNAGQGQTLDYTFTPTDTVDYSSVTGSVLINVLPATPTFSSLNSPTIVYGTTTATVSGRLSANAGAQMVPEGENVQITLNNVTQTATVVGAGDFSTTFDSTSLGAANSPYAISFSYAGDDNFNGATGSSTLAVNQASQSILFNTNSYANYGTAITLSASGGGSGNPVTFAVLSGPATLAGKTLTFTGVGSVVVIANEAGNANYAAATPVQQTIVVTSNTQSDAYVAYIDAYYCYQYANAAYTNGTGSYLTMNNAYSSFYFAFYAYYLSAAGQTAASETCAYYAYYYGYLAYYYAFTDYVGSGNASTGAYDAFYYGYYDWNNSYNVAIGN